MKKVMNVTVTKAANELAEYWSTYNDQSGVNNYTESIFLDDALYGIGVSMNSERFREAPGDRAFRWMLFRYLENTLLLNKSPRDAWDKVVKTWMPGNETRK